MSTRHAGAPRRLLVLWDVDHTLVDTAGVSREAFGRAFDGLTGATRIPDVDMNGRTDRAIISEILLTLGLTDDEQTVGTVCRNLAAALHGRRERLRLLGRALPGADRALRAVRDTERDTVQSVLTGNIEATARTKLATFGLDRNLALDAGAYGDASVDRAELLGRALVNFEREFPGASAPAVVIVGDSLHDVRAAQANGVRCVGVATGRDPAEALAAAGADVVLDDLRDTAAVTRAICSWQWR